MAATPFQPSPLGAIAFDIYNDAAHPPAMSPGLPGGACNYVDLTPGANGSKCGCRRFWSRHALGTPIPDQAGWCMCNHHACYHDEDSAREVQPTQVINNSNNPEQENERPKSGRDPLSPVMGMPLNDAAAMPGFNFSSFGEVDNLSFIHRDPEPMDPYTGAPASTHPGSSMPDTLAWGDTNPMDSHAGAVELPPIPAQCLMPSQTASTTSSVRARYLRPFAGKGLQTLSGVTSAKVSLSSQMEHKPGSPTVTGRDASTGQHPSTQGSQGERSVVGRGYSTRGISHEMFKNMSDTVSSHEQRLDRLETVSFSTPGHDDCHEKHDHIDLRVTDLESRMEEVEKLAANDNASVVGRPVEGGDDAASQSMVSIATSTTSRPIASQDLYSQVQSLSAQVAQLQSALPSWVQPWEVEVVYLPFPLKKLWQNIHLFKSDTSSSGDEWTTQMTVSSATLRSQSPFHSEWAPPGQDTAWLLPRACGDKSILDKRLRSRGLIKKISVKGPDARSVQLAIHSVFGDVFRGMQLPERPQSPSHLSGFLGLQSTWVPLRKIHKDSRLRFLSPQEMVSATMWNVQFLNTVMMKAAVPRLFVTHPDAYIQDQQAFEVGWSWQRIRELSPIGLDVTESQEAPDEDVHEEYWAWSEQLDGAPDRQVPAGSRQDERYASSSPHPYQAAHAASGMRRSPTPNMMRGPSPMLKGRRGSRPPNIRTVSVPLSTTSRFSPISGRRVASSGENRRPTPSIRIPQVAIAKRRQTRSPSYHRFTPRWTASPSPMPLGLNEYQSARGTTPFAYATPHSNAPLQEIRPIRGSSLARNEPEYPYEEDDQDDYDMHAYENDSGDMYDDEEEFEDEGNESAGSVLRVTHNPEHHDRDSQHAQLPEDEPWPGIEDYDRVSDGENIDPRRADAQSDTSSQPSEYPSTQSHWPPADTSEFHIHEDEDGRPGN